MLVVVIAALVATSCTTDDGLVQGPRTTTRVRPRDPTPSGPGRSATAGGSEKDIYAGITPDHLAERFEDVPARVIVPNGLSRTVTIIDAATGKVLSTVPAGREPQHVVPTWNLDRVWVLDNSSNDVFSIDPVTGKAGPHLEVDDPYNLYFTPDGSEAIVVAEQRERLDFRDPTTMALHSSLSVPGCKGLNHADYSADFSYLVVTCEFAGSIAKIDMRTRTVVGRLDLSDSGASATGSSTPSGRRSPRSTSMPQDVRTGPDGHHFYVADMMAGGLHVIDGDTFTKVGFVPTGVGAHGITPARDGRRLFVANRGSDRIDGAPHGPGSVSVLDTASGTVTATWPVPGGGSPDMGNLSVDGNVLWLSGRYDSEVYAFDTRTGELVHRVEVGGGPHGLTVWPQPGSFSLGHTGNTR